MIAAIGFMIGCYILVRLVTFVLRRGQPVEYWAVRGLSAVAGIVTTFVMVYLFVGPGDLTRPASNTSTAAALINPSSQSSAASQPAPANQPAAANDDTARMKQMIEVTLDNTQIVPEDTRAGRFNPALRMSFTYRNAGNETIRAFTGVVVMSDLFDRPHKRYTLTHDISMLPGVSQKVERSVDINRFITEDRWIEETALTNMKVTFEPSSILLADGRQIGKAA